nr:M28 family peptidase [Streptomyces sp. HNM0574]
MAAAVTTALAVPLLLSPAPASTPATASAGARAPESEGDRQARELVRRSGADGAMEHVRALDAAARASGGNRAAGTEGHARSARYAAKVLRDAGYEVTYQHFTFTYREAVAQQLTVHAPHEAGVPVSLLKYSRSTPKGGTKAQLREVPPDKDKSTGCEPADYSGDFDGRIALIRRGGCTFAEKQAAAHQAGAAAALIYNTEDGPLHGSLDTPDAARIPTGGLTRQDGERLAKAAREDKVSLTVDLRELRERRRTANVLAETPGGDADRVVMLGAHLDSVHEGPGINDNASGAAGILESAQSLAEATDLKTDGRPPNKVRFALWSAEEMGLQGSEAYVRELPRHARERIALYLNFDMIASPNPGLFVYDGDDSDGDGAGPGPEGSGQLERGIEEFLTSHGHTPRGKDFDGRSDYAPFVAAGIPSGGTFTGAEDTKGRAERELWGGEAGEPYDPCYHRECDGLDNLDHRAFDVNVKVIADAVGHYAWSADALP